MTSKKISSIDLDCKAAAKMFQSHPVYRAMRYFAAPVFGSVQGRWLEY